MTHTNILMIEQVAHHLGGLRGQMVFLGGAVTALLLTDPAASAVRATQDVDVIVEIASMSELYALEDALRKRGFRNVQDVICRWRINTTLVDVMPTDSAILGFSNRWYHAAVQYAQTFALNNELSIRLVTPEYFLATKLEAFFGRGQSDYLLSHDLEDIVTVLDGRPEIVQEVQYAADDVREYLETQMQQFLHNQRFLDALYGHLSPDEAEQRYPIVLQRIQQMSERLST